VRSLFFFYLLALCAACNSCNKSGPGGTAPAPSAAFAAALSPDAAAPDRPPEVDDMWARAKDGEEDDLVRLARREGVTGLEERGAHPTYRVTAARALGFTEGFAALPWLAEVGTADGEAAEPALESAVTLAAQRRHQRDPEDAEELRTGCDKLLVLAKDAGAPRKKRILAVRALRMLTDTGAVKTADIPGDVDAK
jgi:hypothetical protein